ncbi:hypothetical protein E8E11_008596 [Didymella keratinophila]|nr:hypothetical protein E8E11_008596 [Didymella keratinophila]
MAPSRTMTGDTFTDEKTPVSPTNTDTSTLQGDAIIEIREDNDRVDLEAAPVAAGEHAQPEDEKRPGFIRRVTGSFKITPEPAHDEITELEKELDNCDWDDFEEDPERPKARLVGSDEEGERTRRTVLREIKTKLMEYDDVLIKVRTLESFQRPSDRDYRSVRRYYNNTKPLHDGEMESVRCKEDIVSISTGRERAAFDGGVETLIGQVDGTVQKWFNLKQPPLLKYFRTPELAAKTKNTDISLYSATRIDKMVNIFITFVIFILLIVPIVTMYQLTSTISIDANTPANTYRNTFNADYYIETIAEDILTRIPHRSSSSKRLHSKLPYLLNAYALKLYALADAAPFHDAGRFISLHKFDIVYRLEQLRNEPVAGPPDQNPKWNINRKIQRSLQPADDLTWPSLNADESEIKETSGPNPLPDYQGFIVDSAAHKWFVNQIEQVLILEVPSVDNDAQSISESIVSRLMMSEPLGTFSHPRPPPSATLRLDTNWNPHSFFVEQGYEGDLEASLHNTIVLIGVENDAQATTVTSYLWQCWPSVTRIALDALDQLIRSDRSIELTAQDNNGRDINETGGAESPSAVGVVTAEQKDAQATFHITGTVEWVAEVAEALTWLTTALQMSGQTPGARSSTPCFNCGETGPGGEVRATIIHEKDTPCSTKNGTADTPGTCWLSLFYNPVIVEGFPIPVKPHGIVGLEMHLGLMAALVHSQRVTNFSGRLMMKGFSAMLVLTKRIDDVHMWHLIFDEDDEHISYDDPRVREIETLQVDAVDIEKLQSERHTIGWCSQVTSLTGSPSANYRVRYSQLPRPRSGFALEKVSISGGKIVSAGLSFAIGKKDKPLRIKAPDNYVRQLKWVAKKYVILFDIEDKRAWLVDGASALLHLVRASLKQEEEDGLSSGFLFRSDQIKEAGPEYVGKRASFFVLEDPINQSIQLHRNADDESEETTVDHSTSERKTSTNEKSKRTYYRFRNRVEEIYHLLDQIVAYQSQARAEDGITFRLKTPFREQLEGFDFMDVAASEDPLRTRSYKLQSSGKAWVDFAREIQAITLFGTGFGELLMPSSSTAMCASWREVPKGFDYLAASVSDLAEIRNKLGTNTAGAWQLVNEVYWHQPDKLFESCDCGSSSPQKRCDRIQTLLPGHLPGKWMKNCKSPAMLEAQGAVIFGARSSKRIDRVDTITYDSGHISATHLNAGLISSKASSHHYQRSITPESMELVSNSETPPQPNDADTKRSIISRAFLKSFR